MSIVRILEFVRSKLQREDLLVDLSVRTTGVNINLGILFLSSQTLSSSSAGVCSSVSTIPAVLLHWLLPRPNIRILTENVGEPGPEAASVLHLGDDVGDEGVEGVAGHDGVVGVPGLDASVDELLISTEASSLSLAQSWLTTILKHLRKIFGIRKRKYFTDAAQHKRFVAN